MKKCKTKNCNNVAQQGGVCCLHGAVSRAHAKQCSADGCTNTTQRKGLCRYHANKAGRNSVAVGATPSFDGEHQNKVDGNETELVVAQNFLKVLKQQLHDKNQQFINCSEQLEAANQEVERYKKDIEFKDSALEQLERYKNEIELKNSALEQTQTMINDLRQLLKNRERDFVAQTSKDQQQIQQLSNQLQSLQQGVILSTNCLQLSLPSECGKDQFRLIDGFKTETLKEINNNIRAMKEKKKFHPINNTGGSLMQLRFGTNFSTMFGPTNNKKSDHNLLNDRFREEVLSHIKINLADVKINYDLVMATAIYTRNGEMKQPQPAHMDYINDIIFFSPETTRTGNKRTLQGHDSIPWTGHMPITENGRHLFLWNGPGGKVMPFLIPYGKMLLIRGDVVHAGGSPLGERIRWYTFIFAKQLP